MLWARPRCPSERGKECNFDETGESVPVCNGEDLDRSQDAVTNAVSLEQLCSAVLKLRAFLCPHTFACFNDSSVFVCFSRSAWSVCAFFCD